MGAGVVAEVLVFMAMSRIFARVSVRHVLLASFLLAALRWLLLGNLADIPAVLVFAQLLHAATFGCFHAAAIAFVQGSFGARQQGQGQALYAALSGTGGALGALYSGYSWKLLGPSFTFGMASVAALAAAVIIALCSKQTRPAPDEHSQRFPSLHPELPNKVLTHHDDIAATLAEQGVRRAPYR